MILDFHTHLGDIFPHYHGIQLQSFAPLLHYFMISSSAIVEMDRVFYRNRPRWWSKGFLKHVFITLRQRKRSLQGMVIPNLLTDMQRHEIEKSVVLPIEYLDGIPRSRSVLQACQQVPSLIPFCSVHPKDPHRIEKLDEYIRMGARGLKLHPVFQRVAGDDPCMFELCEEYAPYHLPLILHSGLTGRERQRTHRRFAALELLQSIPAHFSQIPVIFAHAGIAQFELALTLAKRCENLYLELSGQPAQHIRQALTAIGSERLLFGSDWPFWPQTLSLQALRQAVGRNTAAETRMLWENARSILRLEAE
ncbi:amidohydrolase family protein [Candidatus Vecturithrix granuli]|uniref:Amidohydrolase family protein n=1 Tax=Vecturithrix granuli TaxID=1499967 RepID=A0A081BWZ9_VECG1|nr:amidohydrolase family protein [Candidatus Vecturithrix granuli]